MADSLARKVAQQDDLLSKLDSIAREFDNYDYGLPMGEENLEQMRAEIDKYDAEALAPMREALQALVETYGDYSRAAEFVEAMAKAERLVKGKQ